MPTQLELRELARARLEDVRALHRAGRYDAAAYLCGYVVELSLKACICKRLRLLDYPPKGAVKQAFMTHDFDDLLLLAGLRDEMMIPRAPILFGKWTTVIGWRPDWRYRAVGTASKQDVEEMLNALLGRDGVMTWLKRRW